MSNKAFNNRIWNRLISPFSRTQYFFTIQNRIIKQYEGEKTILAKKKRKIEHGYASDNIEHITGDAKGTDSPNPN